tara:strand:- start:2004 stop:3608 length:1605 start_codon:yes stop_codon:yes gene_type:complete
LKKILIIEDSINIVNALKNLFVQKNDFEVYVAKNLEEACKEINKVNFFLIISNEESLEVIKTYNIPSIVLCSKIDKEIIETLKSLNIIDYVLKDSIYSLEYIYKLTQLLVFIKGLNVLVVRQTRESCLEIQQILESLFLNVTLAFNGVEALDIIENHSDISLVISDYKLPLLDGFELTKALRKDEESSKIPILLLSDDIDNTLKVNLFKIGIDYLMINPILNEEIKLKIINLFLNIKQIDEINSFNKIFDDNIVSSLTDTKGVITFVSTAFCNITGYDKYELIGEHHNIIRHPDMPSSIYEDLWKTIKEGKTWKGEIKNLRKDGSSYWISAVIEPIFDKQNNKIGYSAVTQDITDKKRIYELSITDGLTSLYNRRYFNDIAKSIIDKTVRSNEVFGFMLLDIDNFKKYNDSYGHQEGDNVLISISNSLKKSFKRSDDLIFRLGGEEFGILINAKKEEDILNLASKARKDIEDLSLEHKENSPSFLVTASFGLVIISTNNLSVKHKLDYIYKKADDKLYKAKENGRNKIEYEIIK